MVMEKKKKSIFCGLFIAAALYYLIASGFHDASVRLSLEDLLAKGVQYQEHYVRTEGRVIPSSVHWDTQANELTFTITSLADSRSRVPVLYRDVRPDNFENAAAVVVGGYYTPGGVFQARELITKCPSKYERAAVSK